MILETIIEKRQAEVNNYSEEEQQVYIDACNRFEKSRTYIISVSDEMKQALKHRYGLYQIEIYNRSYNKRERDNDERQISK